MKKFFVAVSAALLASGTAIAQSAVVVTPDSSTDSATVVVPGDVTTYVTKQEIPSGTYDGDIAVGSELPSSVEIYPVPSNGDYAYTVINKTRVIVDPHTHQVIEIVK